MKNPIFNRQHITEYFIYGLIAAIAFITPVLFFLNSNKYENFYLVYLGNILFMFVIFYYAFRLIYRPYDKKRAVTMLMAGSFATAVGVIISCIAVIISTMCFFPHLLAARPYDTVIANAPANVQTNIPGNLLVMLLLVTIMGNAAVGGFISVVTAYAGKRNQTKDKPADLTEEV